MPDRKVLMQSRRECLRILGGMGITATALGSGGLAALTASVAKAQSVRTPGGPVPPLELWIPNYPDVVEIARQLPTAWAELGIKVEVRQGTIHTWTAEIVGEHKMPHLAAMSWGGSPDRLDPDYFLTEFLHSSRTVKRGNNYGGYVNKEYDDVVDAQRAEMDTEKRRALVHRAQAIAAADNPMLVLFFRDYINAYNSDRWEGVVPSVGSGITMPYLPWSYLKMKPKTGRKLVQAVNRSEMHTLNPFGTTEVLNVSLLRWIYPPFVMRDEDTRIVPWAAESWKVNTPTEIDVTIRPDMVFHDGRPVTIEDAKFTFDFIAKWKFPAFTRVTTAVAATEIVGPRTLRIQLKQPTASFVPNVLGFAFIAPRHIWEPVGESSSPIDWPNSTPVGSGPFSLGEFRKGEYVFMKANKAHWMAPHIDGVYFRLVPSIENQLGMLERGEADVLAWFIDKRQADAIDQFPHITVGSAPSHGPHEIRINMGMPPVDDPKFRLALQQATDRKSLLNSVFGGAGTAAGNSLITPALKDWYNPEVPNPDFDLDAARKTLRDAGYTIDADGMLRFPT